MKAFITTCIATSAVAHEDISYREDGCRRAMTKAAYTIYNMRDDRKTQADAQNTILPWFEAFNDDEAEVIILRAEYAAAEQMIQETYRKPNFSPSDEAAKYFGVCKQALKRTYSYY